MLYFVSAGTLAVAMFIFNFMMAQKLSATVYSTFSILISSMFIVYGFCFDWLRASVLKKAVFNGSYFISFIKISILFLAATTVTSLLLSISPKWDIGLAIAFVFLLIAYLIYESALVLSRVNFKKRTYSFTQLGRALILFFITMILFVGELNFNLGLILFLFALSFIIPSLASIQLSKSRLLNKEKFWKLKKRDFAFLKISYPLIFVSGATFLIFYGERFILYENYDANFFAASSYVSELTKQVVLFPLTILGTIFFTYRVKEYKQNLSEYKIAEKHFKSIILLLLSTQCALKLCLYLSIQLDFDFKYKGFVEDNLALYAMFFGYVGVLLYFIFSTMHIHLSERRLSLVAFVVVTAYFSMLLLIFTFFRTQFLFVNYMIVSIFIVNIFCIMYLKSKVLISTAVVYLFFIYFFLSLAIEIFWKVGVEI